MTESGTMFLKFEHYLSSILDNTSSLLKAHDFNKVRLLRQACKGIKITKLIVYSCRKFR